MTAPVADAPTSAPTFGDVRPPVDEPMPADLLPPHRLVFTRRQFHALADPELFAGRYELIEGTLLNKMGQNRPHALVIIRLTAWMFTLFGAEFVQFQLPILLPGDDGDTSEPEPDAVAFHEPAESFAAEPPPAAAVVLLVEVSDTTLAFDRRQKARLYARAGIADYWILDINARQLLVHRQPTDGTYTNITAYGENDPVAPLARPDATVRAADLLPPAYPGGTLP